MYSGIIYCACSPLNKKYYGRTLKPLDERIKIHLKNKKNQRFPNALKKYGSSSFKWKIIESFERETLGDLDKILNERERFWIQKDKTLDPVYGYNMSEGGDRGPAKGIKHKKHTQKTRDNISSGKIGIPMKESTKEILREINLGHQRQSGEKNSQKGKKWMINSEKTSKKLVKIEETEKYLTIGWVFGRKLINR
jgi:group I intron endonuclease